jgi:hypothetical protein
VNRLIVMALIAGSLALGLDTLSYASDWDKAGKAFAIIEGVRVVTGGKVDVIGAITGINRPRQEAMAYSYSRAPVRQLYADRRGGNDRYERYERVWIPHYVWKERYIPQHTEYRPSYGEVVVDGHNEKYMVEQGGHWEIRRR